MEKVDKERKKEFGCGINMKTLFKFESKKKPEEAFGLLVCEIFENYVGTLSFRVFMNTTNPKNAISQDIVHFLEAMNHFKFDLTLIPECLMQRITAEATAKKI